MTELRAVAKSTWVATCVGIGITLGVTLCAQAQEALTITLTGQSMIRGDTRVDAPEAVAAIDGLVRGDIAFTNFEATIFEPKKGHTIKDGRFLSPPESLEALKSFGFNLLSLSNNHSFDLKGAGIENTIDAATRLGFVHAGSGRQLRDASKPAYVRTQKGTVGFVSFASGVVSVNKQGQVYAIDDARATATRAGINELGVEHETPVREDAERILNSIREAKKNADIVVVSQHNHIFPGLNFKQMLLSELPQRLEPPAWLKVWAHQMVDAGADVLALHGPPFLHGVELYKGAPIFYSLGNFIFQVPPESVHLEEPIMWESVVADLDFKGGKLSAIRVQPIGLNKIGKGLSNPHDMHDINPYLLTRGLPKPVNGDQAKYLLQRFAAFSKPFGTEVVTNGDVAEIKLLPGAGRR